MDSRERVYKAIEMKWPDRVPIMHTSLPGAFLKYGDRLRNLYSKYPSDFINLGHVATRSGEFGSKKGVKSRDEWGAVWVQVSDDYKGQVVEHPIADWRNLTTYRPPEPLNKSEYLAIKKEIKRDAGRRYVYVDGGTLWQRMFYLRGFENILLDMLKDVKEVYTLRDMILENILHRIDKLNSLSVDGILFRDDWGTQDNLMIRPSRWRELFKPAYAEMFKAVHQGGAHVHFHTDGITRSIIPDLIEIGADVLNPQLSIMNISEFGREFAGRVCFQGGLDAQHTLPKGSVEDVISHVTEIINTFGKFNGGYIGRGDVGPDVPIENVEAMLYTLWNTTLTD